MTATTHLAEFTAANGALIYIRFLTRDDGELLFDLFNRLSPNSRYQRFHVPRADVTEEEIRSQLPFYLSVDGVNHVALVAIAPEAEREVAAGVARFRRKPGAEEAEAAVVVADAWQRQGVGRDLLERLCEVAQAAGVRRLVAWVQASNRSALQLVASLGRRTEHHPEHGEDYLVMFLE